jgi:hypothetical protein
MIFRGTRARACANGGANAGRRPRCSFRGACALALLLMAGCKTIMQNPPGNNGDGTDGPAPTASDPYPDVRVSFEEAQIEVSPGDKRRVQLQASPPGKYPVQLALFGNALGAYLDASELVTDSRGRASVNLTVPLDSKQLTIRASIGRHFSELEVTVRPDAVGTLRILPLYSGKRNVGNWSISVQQDVPCTSLAAYDAVYGPAQEDFPLTVEVDANRTITLLVRGEEYVFGCRAGLFVEASNAQEVTIEVTDRLLQLSALDVPLELGIDGVGELPSKLDAVSNRMLLAFRGGFARDTDALLSRMAQLSSSPDLFALTSENEDWSGQLTLNLTPRGAESGLTLFIQSWLKLGMRRFFTTDTLRGQLTGNVPPNSRAILQLETVAGHVPRDVGIPDSFVLNVSTAAEEGLKLAFDFVWQPAKLLAALAEDEALAQLNTDGGVRLPPNDAGIAADSAVQVLAGGILHCTSVGSLLSGPDGLAFEGCDQQCLGALCTQALETMWQDLRNADASPASFQVTSSPRANIDTQARPVGFKDNWVGKALLGDAAPFDVSGPIAAGPVVY